MVGLGLILLMSTNVKKRPKQNQIDFGHQQLGFYL